VTNGGSLVGTVKPRLIELTCYRVLTRTGDERAGAWLSRAHSGLDVQAATIADAALRRRFLDGIPHHREIAAAWRREVSRPDAG
jgi:hypothetical protein